MCGGGGIMPSCVVGGLVTLRKKRLYINKDGGLLRHTLYVKFENCQGALPLEDRADESSERYCGARSGCRTSL